MRLLVSILSNKNFLSYQIFSEVEIGLDEKNWQGQLANSARKRKDGRENYSGSTHFPTQETSLYRIIIQ